MKIENIADYHVQKITIMQKNSIFETNHDVANLKNCKNTTLG